MYSSNSASAPDGLEVVAGDISMVCDRNFNRFNLGGAVGSLSEVTHAPALTL